MTRSLLEIKNKADEYSFGFLDPGRRYDSINVFEYKLGPKGAI